MRSIENQCGESGRSAHWQRVVSPLGPSREVAMESNAPTPPPTPLQYAGPPPFAEPSPSDLWAARLAGASIALIVIGLSAAALRFNYWLDASLTSRLMSYTASFTMLTAPIVAATAWLCALTALVTPGKRDHAVWVRIVSTLILVAYGLFAAFAAAGS